MRRFWRRVRDRSARVERVSSRPAAPCNSMALAESPTVRAITHVAVERRYTNDVIRDLRGNPGIAALHTTNGRWDLVAEIVCEDLAAFDRVLSIIRDISGIRDSGTSILLRTATA